MSPNRYCYYHSWKCICTLLIPALLIASTGFTKKMATALDGSVIAYINPSRDNQQIRMINPDGSNDRVLWDVPRNTPRGDGIGSLTWKPDATELVFDSGHDGERSMYIRDLYGLAPNGARLRRLTNAPDSSTFADFPQGQVIVEVNNPSATGTELLVYVDGSSDALQFTAAGSMRYTITFSRVADFGPGVRQYVRLINLTPTTNVAGNQCYYDPAVFADVTPGQSVNTGLLRAIDNAFTCVAPFSPSWHADSAQIAYVAIEQTTSLLQVNNIYRISSAPPIQSRGELVLDMGQSVDMDRLFAVAMGPATQSDQMLFVQNGATNNFIYRAPVNDAAQKQVINLGLCPRTVCRIPGIAWLPDGSGFLFSRVESGLSLGNPPPAGGAIYRYSFADSRFTELVRLPNESIGRITLSPDGRAVAFERAASLDSATDTIRTGPRLLCPCSIWVVGIDGANPQQLVADGRAPAWSPRAPQNAPTPPQTPGLEPRVWLPVMRK